MRWLGLFVAMFLALSGVGDAQQGQRRIALVIGVADYNLNRRIETSEQADEAAMRDGKLPDLRNSINDARDIRDALARLKFDTIDYAENPTVAEMIVKLTSFGEKVRTAGPGAVVFVYFSGHGLQMEGENFLVPADAKMPSINYGALPGPAAQAILRTVAVPMDLLRAQLTPRAGPGVNIVVLDACRNNPWDPSTRSAGGRGRGLADQKWGLGQTLIAYSTDPGNTAYDGDPTDRNSPFTLALKAEIERPGVDVWNMFNGVSRVVEQRTVEWRDGAQRPWINSVTVPPEVCLAGCERQQGQQALARAGDTADPDAADLYFWSGCCRRAGAQRTDFEGYLTRVRAGELPGLFREIAESRVQSLLAGPTAGASALIRSDGPRVAASTAALSDDPLSSMQWFLRAAGTGPGQSPGGAAFVTAWPKLAAPGLRPAVVAVVDTGIDRTQVDLTTNIIPGVDLVSDVERANDGDGVDRDAHDAGDACGTGAENSYHGTYVAGLIAAQANNRLGLTGAGFNVVRVQPVRAVGRCGGSLSDIASGIRWAAGVAPATLVSGEAYANPTPADIILLTLALQAPCPASMQAAIDAAVARGAVVVAASGNKSALSASSAPANCRNVIVPASITLDGALAFYSNFGPEIDLLAPGGDSLADLDGDGRQDGLLSTRRTREACKGFSVPGGASSGCDYSMDQGSSGAAALTAAALALMKARTGDTGHALEERLFARALRPIPPAACQIECSKNQFATPIEGQAGMCMRLCGRGVLDMSNAL